jgi:hypothetical protein
LRPTPKTPPGLLFRRALVLAIGCFGLIWGIFAISSGNAADEFWDIERTLLRFETFSPTTLMRTLDSQSSQSLSPCDTHAQRALLLMEMPLAETALRSGAAKEFDRHIQSLQARSRRILSCAPRDSFAWLLLFNLEILHGRLDDHAFNLLEMSYENSPNEAWISIRRIMVAMPLVLVAPQPVRQRILHEFQQLIRNGFTNEAARSYLVAPASVRSLLQAQIDQLNLSEQKAFSDQLQKIRS